MVHQGRRHGPAITYKIALCWVTLLLPGRRAAVLGGPLVFGLIGLYVYHLPGSILDVRLSRTNCVQKGICCQVSTVVEFINMNIDCELAREMIIIRRDVASLILVYLSRWDIHCIL